MRPAAAHSRARRLGRAAGIAALTTLLFAGCSANGTPASTDGGAMPDLPTVEQSESEDAGGGAGADVGELAGDEQRSVIRTGRMSVTADDPIAAAEHAADLATAAGGRVDHRSETPGGDSRSARADLTLRIPADRLDGVIDELRRLGTVNSISIDANDVTQQRVDLDARVEALSASVDRLEALIAQAQSTADLIEIESELTARQSELDGLTAQRDALVDQVDFSTLSLELITEDVAPVPEPATFWDGLVAGWTALVAFGSGLLVVIGAVLPWLAALAVLGGVAFGIVWASVRSRRARRQGTTAVAHGADGAHGAHGARERSDVTTDAAPEITPGASPDASNPADHPA